MGFVVPIPDAVPDVTEAKVVTPVFSIGLLLLITWLMMSSETVRASRGCDGADAGGYTGVEVEVDIGSTTTNDDEDDLSTTLEAVADFKLSRSEVSP